MKNIRNKTVKALIWNAGSSLVNQVLLTLIAIVLTRILEPEDFGLLAMVVVITGFAQIFKDLGFSNALVQRSDLEERHKSTSFWINTCMGGGLTIILYLCAPLVAGFYEKQEIIPIMRFLSITFIISGTSNVHHALLRKELKYKEISIIKVVTAVGAGVLAIILAILGFGVWSLVIRYFVITVGKTLGFWYVDKWKPKLIFAKSAVNDFITFSMNTSATRIIGYVAGKLDILLIGKYIGVESLGIYNRSQQFQESPFRTIKEQISGVVFPSMANVQESSDKQADIYLQLTSLLTLALFPVLIGLFCVAEEFVYALFQRKWASMIPIIQIITISSLFATIGFPQQVFMVRNETGKLLKVTTILRVVRVICILVGISSGQLVNVVWWLALSSAINATVLNYWAAKLLDISLLKVAKSFIPIATIALIMGVVVYLSDYLFLANLQNHYQLVIKSMLGLLVYLGLILLIKPKPVPFILENYWPPMKLYRTFKGAKKR